MTIPMPRFAKYRKTLAQASELELNDRDYRGSLHTPYAFFGKFLSKR